MAESPSIATVVSAVLRCDLVSIYFLVIRLDQPSLYINTFLMFLIFYNTELEIGTVHKIRPSVQ